VARARDVVRGMTASMTADITVYLRGGTYPQTSTLTFGNADSGKNGFYVKYMAYQSERPIVTGGKAITGWTASSAGNGIYIASGVTPPFRQLYVNGVKAIRARSPNLGANGAFAFNRLTGADNTAQNIQVAASETASWNNLTKVEMHVITGWGDNTLRLASMTTSGGTAFLKIQSPEAGIVFVRPYPHLGGQFGGFTKHVYYFENALEFLDQPGEWYLDETQNVLSYKPRAGEDMTKATVVAPVLQTVMSINGTSTSDQAGYLWFQGITFAHSTFMRPSQSGFCDAQAGQYNLTATSDNKQTIGRPPAGVSVMNANHIRFERNIFTQMGATGLDFISGTHDDMIIGNVVTEIAGNGISIGKFSASDTTEYHTPYNPTDRNEICTNDTIKDNYIHHVTTEFQGGTGIAAGYPRQIDIQHNEVAYTNYTAISVGYGWTSSVNAMATNKINNNDIHHAVQILADGAGIYTLSNQQPNSQMQYNYLHDYQTSQWADYGSLGIYLDEQTSGYAIAHNAMVNAPSGVAQNQAGANTISDTPAANPQSVMSMAGIEAAYADIKNLTIPIPSF
jgi:GH141 insertion domain